MFRLGIIKYLEFFIWKLPFWKKILWIRKSKRWVNAFCIWWATPLSLVSCEQATTEKCNFPLGWVSLSLSLSLSLSRSLPLALSLSLILSLSLSLSHPSLSLSSPTSPHRSQISLFSSSLSLLSLLSYISHGLLLSSLTFSLTRYSRLLSLSPLSRSCSSQSRHPGSLPLSSLSLLSPPLSLSLSLSLSVIALLMPSHHPISLSVFLSSMPSYSCCLLNLLPHLSLVSLVFRFIRISLLSPLYEIGSALSLSLVSLSLPLPLSRSLSLSLSHSF